MRDFPLRRVTFRAAEAVRCTEDHAKAEDMRAFLFSGQPEWGALSDPEKLWVKYAAAAGTDLEKWRACMSARSHSAAIESDRRLGLRLGVDATPTVFVGGRKIVGAVPYDTFAGAVRAELSSR